MGRKGVITQRGLAAKVGALLSVGVPYDKIIRQVEREHGLKLTFSQLSRFAKKNIANIDSKLPPAEIVRDISTEVFKAELLAALNTAKARYEEFQHDPRSGLAWFRTHLENLDRMARAIGGYATENRPNVQVNVEPTKNLFDQIKEYEVYFESLESPCCRECPLKHPEKYPEAGADRLKAYFELLEHEKELPIPGV